MSDYLCVGDMLDHVNEIIEGYVRSEVDFVSADTVGLDSRCGNIGITDTHVIVRSYEQNRLNYYGGFEYIDQECVTKIGDYVFYETQYDHDDGRVQKVIDKWQKSKQ